MAIVANKKVNMQPVLVTTATQSTIYVYAPSIFNILKSVNVAVASAVNPVTIPGDLNQNVRPTSGIVYPRYV